MAKGRDAKMAANWVINELFGRLNKEGTRNRDVAGFGRATRRHSRSLGAGTISGKIAKELFEIVWSEGGDPRAIVEARGMRQVTDLGAIDKVIDEIIANNPDKVADAKSNAKAIGWFVGQVMKSPAGKTADPKAINAALKAKLGV